MEAATSSPCQVCAARCRLAEAEVASCKLELKKMELRERAAQQETLLLKQRAAEQEQVFEETLQKLRFKLWEAECASHLAEEDLASAEAEVAAQRAAIGSLQLEAARQTASLQAAYQQFDLIGRSALAPVEKRPMKFYREGFAQTGGVQRGPEAGAAPEAPDVVSAAAATAVATMDACVQVVDDSDSDPAWWGSGAPCSARTADKPRSVVRSCRGCHGGVQRLIQKALEQNVARELAAFHEGFVLEKVHGRNSKREPRFLWISAEKMKLYWSKGVQRGNRSRQSSLDLYEVIQIHYGCMSRACVLYPELSPWLCFSLHTSSRSFDFCCPDEATVRACVLSLSRLCTWAAGAGALKKGGRREFKALSGWCKLQDACFRRHTSLGHLFCDALRRSYRQYTAAWQQRHRVAA